MSAPIYIDKEDRTPLNMMQSDRAASLTMLTVDMNQPPSDKFNMN